MAIVGVTKGRSLDDCRDAMAAGLRILGENRVQEALPKLAALPTAAWHLIGHLQTNKAKHADRFAMIQSVDGERLAAAVARHAPRVPCLLEVNVGREPQKFGCPPEEAVATARRVATHLDIWGLMCVAAPGSDPRPQFAEMYDLRARCQEVLGVPLPVLSMGMTDDWEAAVEAGSTMLRLGRRLFGDGGTPGPRLE